jgi:hypothetical protein
MGENIARVDGGGRGAGGDEGGRGLQGKEEIEGRMAWSVACVLCAKKNERKER